MSTKTGTILVIGLGHCWGGQANVSATHSDAHAPQIYTRLFWCMVVCETRCHQIHSTFPRGLPLLLVDRRIDFWKFFGYFLAVEKKWKEAVECQKMNTWYHWWYGWLSGALEDICNQQSSSGGQLRCLPHLPRLRFFGTHQGFVSIDFHLCRIWHSPVDWHQCIQWHHYGNGFFFTVTFSTHHSNHWYVGRLIMMDSCSISKPLQILSQSFVATVACWRCWSLQVSLHGSMIQDLSNQVLLWFPDFTYFISYHFEAVWCFWLVVV